MTYPLALTLQKYEADAGDVAEGLMATLGWHSSDDLFLLQFLLSHTLLALLLPTFIPAKRHINKRNDGEGWTLGPNSLQFKLCFYPFQAMQSGQSASLLCTLVSSLIIIIFSSQIYEISAHSKCSTTLCYYATLQAFLMF